MTIPLPAIVMSSPSKADLKYSEFVDVGHWGAAAIASTTRLREVCQKSHQNQIPVLIYLCTDSCRAALCVMNDLTHMLPRLLYAWRVVWRCWVHLFAIMYVDALQMALSLVRAELNVWSIKNWAIGKQISENQRDMIRKAKKIKILGVNPKGTAELAIMDQFP